MTCGQGDVIIGLLISTYLMLTVILFWLIIIAGRIKGK